MHLRIQPVTDVPPALEPMSYPQRNVLVCPDLSAFTQDASSGESQEPPEYLDPHIFDNTVAYYLRRPNFGFAASEGSLAIIEAVPGPAADRMLVIARHGSATYARRLVRAANTDVIGLTAEVSDPRTRTPKTIFIPEAEVAIHQVVGVIFNHSVTVTLGQDELGRHKDALVALTLDDGSSIFKRVGAALPSELDHLRQFESIGGLGSSQIFSVGNPRKGFQSVTSARATIGVLYHG